MCRTSAFGECATLRISLITSMDNNITATRLFLASPGTAVFVGCQSKLELSAYEGAFCGLRYR